MSSFTQAGRPLTITTPLGPDALLLVGVEGHEEVSGLFRFRLELLADRATPVPFDAVLGKPATVGIDMAPDGKRWIDGIVCRLSQGGRDATFTHLEAVLVPRLWLLTRKVRSRLFQRRTVPEIVSAVLGGVPHRLEISGTYEPRDYCTQYRESDFAFVSRLMEEEGIRYYFVHSDGAHEMVVTDAPFQHPAVPGPEAITYEEVVGKGHADEMRVTSWTKSQEIRSTLTTLRDHCFELPGQGLEAQQAAITGVAVGEVVHEMKVAPEELEVYDFPGGYAGRFDGSTRGGSACPDELGKIFPDGLRTVRIRMEQEEAEALEVRGESTCRHFVAGHRFTLTRHFDAGGPYVLARVEHRARLGADYRSGEEGAFTYGNLFTALPTGLSCRPRRVTPRPVIAGTQTATVVAPPGEELWCDRYGRVKVQFHWDREGKKDLDSSCWVRVAQTWAGRSWGAFFWPRAGNEVVVAFEEGDPDQPVIVGSLYNAENRPPFELPLRKELAGFKSASLRGFANRHFNGLVFADGKGNEHLAIHSQRTMTLCSENDKSFASGRNQHESVSTFSTRTVGSLPGGGSGGGPAGVQVLDSLPGGAGSGGGNPTMDDQKFGYTFTGNSSWHPLGFVQPSGLLGLQAATVFGENLSLVCGLGRSISLGSSLTMTVNPGALAQICGWKTPSVLEAVNGTGAGGSATFTFGTNTNFVLGTTYNIAFSKAKEIEIGDSVAAKIISVILAIATYVFVAAYGLIAWDIARTCLVIAYDLLIGGLITVLMLIVAGKEEANDTWTDTLEKLYKPVERTVVNKTDTWKNIGGVVVNLLTVGNQLAPVGAAIIGDAVTFGTGIADAATDAKAG